MSETTDVLETPTSSDQEAPAAKKRRGTGLSGMVLAELQAVASGLGITGTGKMRKSDLIAAITERQSGGSAPSTSAAPAEAGQSTSGRTRRAASRPAGAPAQAAASASAESAPVAVAATTDQGATTSESNGEGARRSDRVSGQSDSGQTQSGQSDAAQSDSGQTQSGQSQSGQSQSGQSDSAQSDSGDDRQGGRNNKQSNRRNDRDNNDDRGENNDRQGNRNQRQNNRGSDDRSDNNDRNNNDRGNSDRQNNNNRQNNRGNDDRNSNDRNNNDRQGNNDRNNNDRQGNNDRNNNDRNNNDRNNNDRNNNDRNNNDRQGNNDRNPNNSNDFDDDDRSGGRRRRRGRDRYRDRNDRQGNNQQGGRNNNRDRYSNDEPTVSEDDVLLPIAGILDVLDNYAFVRTSGYLTGSNDVYVSLSQVRRYGLRRGDAITGAVKQPRDGERREKFNALVRLDTINGLEPDAAKNRPEFQKLTPLYPQSRLRLETESHIMTTRVIDLVMPIGKGQRALIVSPPKAGKTMVLQALANAITTNNPECHLMVVLVDERPEEVTDMQRSVKGEVIASTFDRPPADHTTVAELSIERAKRLVELGHDVVVLLDSITRLGRAYNLAAPTSGRILSGGVDSTALYPPKRFLGAARNIENGGSLTIIATALVETGSTMDTVIFEEFKGTGNAELKLDRRIADKRVFPAIDVNPSGTRKEEILLGPDELSIIIKLRRVLQALEPQQAIDLLLDRLKKSKTNAEFLMQIAKSTPGSDD